MTVNNGGTINGAASARITDLPCDWTSKEYRFEIKGATAATTLTFSSDVADGQFSRWFIDDILVK